MSNWAKAGLSASLSGSIASVVTAATLAALARSEGKSAWQPSNSTSHWLHGEDAARVRHADAAHTLTGYATHHASAIFWAFPFERWLQTRPPRTTGQMLAEAAGMSAIAAAVDYGLAPKRFTPGWEDVLSVRSIAFAYGALALGLAAGALVTQRMRQQAPDGGRHERERHPRSVKRTRGGGSPRMRGERDRSAHDHRQYTGAEKLYDLIDDIRICMMTTTGERSRMFSRPMYALAPDEAGDLWFFTRIASPKVNELAPDGEVNLAFSHPGKQHYVSVSGRAEVLRDRRRIEEKWSEPMRTWFPKGKDDPELALVRVHPHSGEYWDSPSSAVVHLYGYVKASLTGEPPNELSDTRKVDLNA
jgi:general stress protein 26